jgi:hypothetical protein
LSEHYRLEIQHTAGACVHFDQRDLPCPKCSGPMNVRKKFTHGGRTLAHGSFLARETVLECATGCRKPDGHKVMRRQPELANLLLPGSIIGYDVMARVGIARFVRYQQRETIRNELAQTYGLPLLSTGEISALQRRFLIYLHALHVARAPKLRERLEQDGGWPLHIDATGEAGRGTMLVAWAGWRHWVLGSWKIPSENAEAILAKLRIVHEQFATPCGIMRDLGRAVIRASLAFVNELDQAIPIWGCHFHLVRDVGKDLLTDSYDQLRTLFRDHDVRARLRAMARDLSQALGSDLGPARQQVEGWMAATANGPHQVPAGRGGIAVGRALSQWVLDFPADGQDEGFPFDLPYLDLFKRCQKACRAVEAFLHSPTDDARVRDILERLHRIAVVTRRPAFASPVRVLGYRAGLLDELRTALRIEAKPQHLRSDPLGSGPSTHEALEEARAVKDALAQLVVSLRERRPERGPGEDAREAIDLILDHLERHGDTLSGHAIALPPKAGGGLRLVDRTNVPLENFFGLEKHGERKRSGRKNIAADLETLPQAAPLALNLERPDYVEILCGDLDSLPAAFAELDAADRSRSLPARLAKQPATAGANDDRTSLPKPDRKLVRSRDLTDRIRRAARSRAPRRASPQATALPA